jgi:hypothetical protein
MSLSVRRLSRRELLVAGGATLAVGSVSAKSLVRSVTAGDNPTLKAAGREVVTLAPSSANYASAVDSLFPGLMQDLHFQTIAPVSILVTNQSGPPVRGLSVIWSLSTSNGTYEAALRFYCRSSWRHPGTGLRQFLKPGETQLVTPFFVWNPAQYKPRPADQWGFAKGEAQKLLLRQMGQTLSISAQVDAVVYSDWKLLGPDAEGLGRHMSIRRNAEHDESVAVLKLVKTQAPRAVIAALLTSHHDADAVAGTSVPRSDSERHWYYHARSLQAAALLRTLHKSNRSQFTAVLSRARNRPKTQIARLTT